MKTKTFIAAALAVVISVAAAGCIADNPKGPENTVPIIDRRDFVLGSITNAAEPEEFAIAPVATFINNYDANQIERLRIGSYELAYDALSGAYVATGDKYSINIKLNGDGETLFAYYNTNSDLSAEDQQLITAAILKAISGDAPAAFDLNNELKDMAITMFEKAEQVKENIANFGGNQNSDDNDSVTGEPATLDLGDAPDWDNVPALPKTNIKEYTENDLQMPDVSAPINVNNLDAPDIGNFGKIGK